MMCGIIVSVLLVIVASMAWGFVKLIMIRIEEDEKKNPQSIEEEPRGE